MKILFAGQGDDHAHIGVTEIWFEKQTVCYVDRFSPHVYRVRLPRIDKIVPDPIYDRPDPIRELAQAIADAPPVAEAPFALTPTVAEPHEADQPTLFQD